MYIPGIETTLAINGNILKSNVENNLTNGRCQDAMLMMMMMIYNYKNRSKMKLTHQIGRNSKGQNGRRILA